MSETNAVPLPDTNIEEAIQEILEKATPLPRFISFATLEMVTEINQNFWRRKAAKEALPGLISCGKYKRVDLEIFLSEFRAGNIECIEENSRTSSPNETR